MLREESDELYHHPNRHTTQFEQATGYSLSVPEETDTSHTVIPETNTAKNQEDTLKVMSTECQSTVHLQSLSLPEKKVLHKFWVRQWDIYETSPACQNTSEARLREKFNGYVLINIQRRLLEDWNKIFAGRYVLGEPEPRQERTADDLRALTKSWGWLCNELDFMPLPDAIDDEDEGLDNITVDVRNMPFGFTPTSSGDVEPMTAIGGEYIGLTSPAEVEIARTLPDLHERAPLEHANPNLRLMEAARSHYRDMKESYERDVVNKEGIMRDDPRFPGRVMTCMMQELHEMETQGFLHSSIADVVRALIFEKG